MTITLQDIQFRRNTSSYYTSNNPILSLGEPAFETDTSRLKIGDGSTEWTSLPYIGSTNGAVVDSVNGQTGVIVLDTDDIADTISNRFVTQAEKDQISTNASGITTLSSTLGNKQNILSEGAFVDGDKTKLDAISGTNTGDQDISGIATNASAIAAINSYPTADANKVANLPTDQEAINTDIETRVALNDDKVGITTTQASAIIANAAKVSYPGDQDASEVTVSPAINSNTNVQSVLEDHETRIDGLVSGGGGDMLAANNLSDLTNAPTALTNLGLTASAAELNYTDGVTSNIQTQLNTKWTNGGVATTTELTILNLLSARNADVYLPGDSITDKLEINEDKNVSGQSLIHFDVGEVSPIILKATPTDITYNGASLLGGSSPVTNNDDKFTGVAIIDGYEFTAADFTTGKKLFYYEGSTDIEVSVSSDVAQTGEKLILWQYGTGKIQVGLNDSLNGIEFATVDNENPVTLTKAFGTFGYRPIGNWEAYTSVPPFNGLFGFDFNGNTTEKTGTYTPSVTGTLTYGTGQSGQAASFTGSQYIDLPVSADFSLTQLTIAFWVKDDAIASGYEAIIEHNRLGPNWWGVFKDGLGSPGRLNFRATSQPNNGGLGTTQFLLDNAWHYVIATYEGTTMTVYVDGVQNAQATGVVGPTPTLDSVRIGRNQDDGESLTMYIDKLEVWNVGMNPTEVATLYANRNN